MGKAEPFVTLEESYTSMEQALKDAISARDQAIHLIDGQTGLGKSHAYQKLMPDLSTPTIIALPTVKLKGEAYCHDSCISASDVCSLVGRVQYNY